MSSNLTPTAITDKNGKQTTVHKKPAGPATQSVSAIPSPRVSSPSPVPNPADPGQWTAGNPEIRNRFRALMVTNNGGRALGMDKLMFFNNTNDRQRKLFCELLEQKDGFGEIIAAGTSSALSDNQRPGGKLLEAIGLVYDKDLFTEFPKTYRKATKARKSLMKLDSYRKALNSAALNLYVGVERKELMSLGEQSPDKVERVRSFVKLYASYCGVEGQTDYLPAQLSSAAFSGEYSVDDISKVMVEHRTTDINTILGIMNGAAPSIAEGWL